MHLQNLFVNVELKFQFDNTGLEFLVKNFTEDDIYVGFKAGESKEKSDSGD